MDEEWGWCDHGLGQMYFHWCLREEKQKTKYDMRKGHWRTKQNKYTRPLRDKTRLQIIKKRILMITRAAGQMLQKRCSSPVALALFLYCMITIVRRYPWIMVLENSLVSFYCWFAIETVNSSWYICILVVKLQFSFLTLLAFFLCIICMCSCVL